MKRRLLVIDGDNLAHRSFYSRENLSWGGTPTGAVYGFLTDIPILMGAHSSDTVIFCFDHGESLRKMFLKTYKSSRHKKRDPEMTERLGELKVQIERMKKEYLPQIGFANVWYQKGFEADDLIAYVVQNLVGENDEVIIVSTDKDLYQCLAHNVVIWDWLRRKSFWMQDLWSTYGITPKQWVDVKCIAGCSTDDIPGIKGVAELTACKYIRGELPKEYKAYQNIIDGKELIKSNINLVKLPLAGLRERRIEKDDVTLSKWRAVTSSLGMKSLRGKAPILKQGSLF